MRLVADEKYISRRDAIGRYAGIASLVTVVGAALFIFVIQSFSSAAMLIAFCAILGASMIFSFFAGFYGERFTGPLAHHSNVRDALKGLDSRFTLFQYVLPASHVLLGPDGLTVIVVRSHGGKIVYDGKWSHRQRGRVLRELAGQERFGRPEQEVEQQIERMNGFLEENLPGADVPVQGAVFFVNPEAEIKLKNPPVPVFYGKKLKNWLRGPGMREVLPDDVAGALQALLAEAGPAVEAEEAEGD
jgi:hypothetical protein